MSSRPLLLDLFCKAGGAAAGYHRAGFDITGVDIAPQPNYPYPFIQADALQFLAEDERVKRDCFDAYHASPPCQAFSSMKHMPDAKEHAELVDPVRELLAATGRPYVIENVAGAPLRDPLTLCGTMFGLGAAGFELQRHRLFESNVMLMTPGECNHVSPVIGVYGGHVRCRSTKFWRNGGADFPGYDKKQLALDAMGVEHHMTMNELSEAIPPAYTEYVGLRVMEALRMAA